MIYKENRDIVRNHTNVVAKHCCTAKYFHDVLRAIKNDACLGRMQVRVEQIYTYSGFVHIIANVENTVM